MAVTTAQLSALRAALAHPSPEMTAMLDRVLELEDEVTGMRHALHASLEHAHHLGKEVVRLEKAIIKISTEMRTHYPTREAQG